MGGKVDAHGVGITSGLEKRTGMNQGGRVDRGIVGYQQKNHPARQGNREGHSGGLRFLIEPGEALIKAAIKAASKKGGIKEGLASLKNYISGGKTLSGGRPDISKLNAAEKLRILGSKGFGPAGRLSQIGRATGLASTAGSAVGITMSLLDRFGVIEEGNDDSFAESALRTVGKAGVNASIPGIATALTGAALGTDKNPKRKALYDILAGNQLAEEEEETQDLDIKSVAEREAEAYEDMKTEASRKAEMMYEMLNGGVNKMAAISQGLAAATPYIANEQYAEGAAAFTQGLQPELQKDEQLRQTIGAQVLGDIASEKASQDQIKNTLLGSGDFNLALEFTRMKTASEELGLENVQLAPIKDGEIDVDKPGIYVDKDNASGKLYIAVNESLEIKLTDDANEAADFVKTTA